MSTATMNAPARRRMAGKIQQEINSAVRKARSLPMPKGLTERDRDMFCNCAPYTPPAGMEIFWRKLVGDVNAPRLNDGDEVEFHSVAVTTEGVEAAAIEDGRFYLIVVYGRELLFRVFADRDDARLLLLRRGNESKYPGAVRIARSRITAIARAAYVAVPVDDPAENIASHAK